MDPIGNGMILRVGHGIPDVSREASQASSNVDSKTWKCLGVDKSSFMASPAKMEVKGVEFQGVILLWLILG